MMDKNAKIYVAGHNGLVGSAIVRNLQKNGYINLVLRNRAELDLLDAVAVTAFFEKERPEYVFDAAAKVGGIVANDTYPAEFIFENLTIQNNIIHNCYKFGVKKLVFLGSSCIYPKGCPQPMKEEYILTGPLEETNKAYAAAKLAGVIMCQAYNRQYKTKFVSAMPSNAYGPNDHYELETAHVLPAFIRKFSEAKTKNDPEVVVWGTGSPFREFIHVDDIADGCVFLMNNDGEFDFYNLGSGEEISIKDLAELVMKISGYQGKLVWDSTKPNGTPRKLTDTTRLHQMGWKHKIGLEEGIKEAYDWYVANYDPITGAKLTK